MKSPFYDGMEAKADMCKSVRLGLRNKSATTFLGACKITVAGYAMTVGQVYNDIGRVGDDRNIILLDL